MSKPIFNPAEGFPYQISECSELVLYGIVLALVEHQQVVALRTVESTVAQKHHKSVVRHPAISLPKIILASQAHTDRLRRYGWAQHVQLLDDAVDALPDDLPRFVPKHHWWKIEKAYRRTLRHLNDSYRAYRATRDGSSDDELPDAAE